MTEIDRPLGEAIRLRDELKQELIPLIQSEDPEIQEQAVAMGEDLICVDGLLTECKNMPVPRVSSGGPGVMYLDAILRMIDGLTEVLEMIITGLKLYLKAARKLREMAVKIEKWLGKKKESQEEGKQGKDLFAKAKQWASEFKKAVQAKVEMKYAQAAGPIAVQIAKTSGAARKAMAKAATELAEARNEYTKASDYSVENAIVVLEGALAIAKAAYKLVAVVRRTISWATALLSVEPVAFLPIPITGRTVLNIYKWITGDEVPDILKPVIINVARGNFNPVTIAQGVLRTPTVRGWIPNEVYDVPKMPFLGGGSIM